MLTVVIESHYFYSYAFVLTGLTLHALTLTVGSQLIVTLTTLLLLSSL